MSFNFIIDVPATAQRANVDLLRGSVQNCLLAVIHNVGYAQSLATTTGELLENAVKYGDWADQDRKLRLRVWDDVHHAYVQVENPVAPGADLSALATKLNWIRSFATPREAYQARLRELARLPETNESGLGLVRIAYECKCELSAEFKPGVLVVTAARKLS